MQRLRITFSLLLVGVMPFIASCGSSRDRERAREFLAGRWELHDFRPGIKDRAAVEFFPDGTFVTNYFETEAVVARPSAQAVPGLPAEETKVVPVLRSVRGLYWF